MIHVSRVVTPRPQAEQFALTIYHILQYKGSQRSCAEKIWDLDLSLWELSGSVVECLTLDRRAAGSSLTGVTALCP